MPSTERCPAGLATLCMALAAGLAEPAAGMFEAVGHLSEGQRLEVREADSSLESGKLIEPEAFGVKMLDAAAPGTDGAGVVNDPQPSAEGRGTEVGQSGGRGRRILWRQIQ